MLFCLFAATKPRTSQYMFYFPMNILCIVVLTYFHKN
jgi:hypothetical protein